MDFFFEIWKFIYDYVPIQFFLLGAIGAIMFDLTLYFKPELGLAEERRKRRKPKQFGIIYVICQTIYSSTMGGLLALWLNHALWLAFTVGFCSSIFLTFTVKLLIEQGTKQAFWITIGKLVFDVVGSPLKKALIALESATYIKSTKQEDETNK